jgi:hypothetical protein
MLKLRENWHEAWLIGQLLPEDTESLSRSTRQRHTISRCEDSGRDRDADRN